MNDSIKKRNKRLSIYLGLFAITIALLSFSFWKNLATMVSLG